MRDNKQNRLPDHVILTTDFVADVFVFRSDDGRVQGDRLELLSAIELIVGYTVQYADREWPGDLTYFLNLCGELAAVLICEYRSPCPYLALRNLLQSMYGTLQSPLTNRPAMQRERLQQLQDLAFVKAAACETEARAACTSTTTTTIGKNNV